MRVIYISLSLIFFILFLASLIAILLIYFLVPPNNCSTQNININCDQTEKKVLQNNCKNTLEKYASNLCVENNNSIFS